MLKKTATPHTRPRIHTSASFRADACHSAGVGTQKSIIHLCACVLMIAFMSRRCVFRPNWQIVQYV